MHPKINNSTILLGAMLLIVLIGGFLAYKQGPKLFVKDVSKSSPTQFNFSESASWKENVNQIINQRADVSVTTNGLLVQLEPIDNNNWNVVIKNTDADNSHNSVLIISKKLNLNIDQSTPDTSTPITQKIDINTTMSDTQLKSLINSLPDN